ncbi:F-actin-capping protein subunit alpha [Malassezia nana]|uniref:F-actin-capping protein subunit alpha n=1 Tax=Malassezia nana TaxID=180528 RepID=A0AAF0EJV9_9BASI|nr:F-actin-capping protein subunit alpha [Malassezia nana]
MSRAPDDDAVTQCLALLLQSPPGQRKNVLMDVQGILSTYLTADEVAARARSVLEQHAHEQLLQVPIQLDGQKDEAILCSSAKMDDEYIHPRLPCRFTYDHVQETIGEVTACPKPTDAKERLRAAVDEKLSQYVYEYYHTGMSLTFAQGSVAAESAEPTQNEDGNDSLGTHPASDVPFTLTLHIVGNKYNLRNFWAGRWRSTYVVDVNARTFSHAQIQIQTHYFENGNVQMHGTCQPSLPTLIDTEDLPDAILSAICAYEQAYQGQLCEAVSRLRDSAFKALRRTLPITRQKIDWDKVVSYKLGSELANK